MFRLHGLSASVRELATPSVTDAFAFLTRLGDPLFLLVIVLLYYWLSDERDKPAQLIAIMLLTVAVTVTLKNGLALPRPPAEVQAVPADGDSHGFPSGHAIGSTVVYGGLVAVEERLQRVGPASALAVLVGLIGLSRVVIGVHYVGDVLVGFAVGSILLAVLWYSESRHRPLLAVTASVVAVLAVLVSGPVSDATLVLGSSLGAIVVFIVVETASLPTSETTTGRLALVAVGMLVLGGTYSLAATVGHPVALAAGGAVMFSGSLLAPLALESEPVGRVVSE